MSQFTPRSTSIVFVAFVLATLTSLVAWQCIGADSTLQRWLERSGFDLALASLGLAVTTVLFAVPIGAGIAVLTSRTDVCGQATARWLLLCFLFVPLYLQAAAWNAGFGTMGWYTLSSGPLVEPLLSGFRAAVWVHAMAAIPWVTLIVSVGLRHVEYNLEEQASLSYSPVDVFARVTLPRIAPALIVATIWTALLTTSEMVVTDIFRVRAYAEVVYSGFAQTPDAGLVTARVLPGIVFVAVLTCLALVLAMTFAAQAPAQSYGAHRVVALRRWRWPATVGLWLVIALIAGVPLGNLMYKAGVVATLVGDDLVRTWSIAKFIEILAATPMRFREEFGWSGLIGASSATVTVGVALPLAWIARAGGWKSMPALLTTAILLAVPGPLIGLSIVWLLQRDGMPILTWIYDRTIIPPVGAACTRSIPIAIMTLWFTLRSVHRSTLESAALDGVTPLRTLLRVVLPQRWRSIVLAWLISFAVAAGDLSATVLVLPPDVETVPFTVFSLIHSGVRYDEAAISLYVVAGVFVVAALIRFAWPKFSK